MDSNKYTGELTGPRDLQTTLIGPFTMVKTTVGPMDNNCYFLVQDTNIVLIDACGDADHLLAVAERFGGQIKAVITTHQHADHVGALEEVLAATGAVHISTAGESEALPVPADILVADGDDLADVAAQALAGFNLDGVCLSCSVLRGHTPEGLAIALQSDGPTHLFVGDSLFPGGVGKTNSPAQFEQLLSDVTTKLFERFPDNTQVHPGHGADTSLGSERPHLNEWRTRGW